VEELAIPPALTAVIAPLLELLGPINNQIAVLDKELGRIVAAKEVARHLTTVPGVGPVTAAAFVATVDDVTRFRDAHQVEAHVGLILCEWSSSETQRRGHITKAGNGRLRWLLVQAAWCILRRRPRPETAALRAWADRIAPARRRARATAAMHRPRRTARRGRLIGGSAVRRGEWAVSARLFLADVESRDPDGAAVRSHHPSCAGESSFATKQREEKDDTPRTASPTHARPSSSHTRGRERH
jgi:hypothetical protein